MKFMVQHRKRAASYRLIDLHSFVARPSIVVATGCLLYRYCLPYFSFEMWRMF